MANNSSLYGNNPPVPEVSSSNSTSLYGGADKPIADASGNVLIRGDLAVNGGDITTTAQHASLFNTNATTLDIGGEATTINIGASTGITTINNNLDVGGNICLDGDTLTLRCNSTGPGNAVIQVHRGTGIYLPAATITWDESVPTPVEPWGRWVYNAGINTTGATIGNVDIGVNDQNNQITTLLGDLHLTSITNRIDLSSGLTFVYNENNDRLNRINVQSTSGDTSGLRVLAPNATASANSIVSTFSTNDLNNGSFVNINARNSLTDPLRIQTGKYTSGVLGDSGTSLAFIDNTTAYAYVNPNGTTNPLDLATKSYVDSHELNTTYTIDSSTTTGGANFNLTGSDSTVDTIKIANGAGITAVATDANSITVTNTGVRSITGTTNQVIASASTGAVTLSLPQSIATTSNPTFAGATLGAIKVGVTTDNTIDTTSGNLTIAPATGIITVAAPTTVQYAEANDRTKRFQFQSSSGNSSGVRVLAPNATTSASSVIGAFNTNDADNGSFINLRAGNGGTNPLRIFTGTYTAGVLGASSGVAFVDNVTTYATVNPSGPTNPLDLITKAYVDALPHVTYAIDASTTTGGANLNLTGSDSSLDSVAYKGSGGTTITRTDANTITISSTDTNTTYNIDASTITGGANLNLTGSDLTTDSVAYKGSGATTVTRTDANTITISSTDTNTTYNIDASTITGGANLNLTGSDSSLDSVAFKGTGGTTVTRTDANTITINSTATTADHLTNGLYTFNLNADGSVTTPSSISASGPLTLRGGLIDPTSLVLDADSSVTTLGGGVGADTSILTATQSNLTWAHTASPFNIGSVSGTWSYNTDGTTSFPTYKFPYADGSSNQVLRTNGSGVLSWYTPSDLNTTYTYSASSATGGANLTLTGSDATTNTVKVSSGTGITVADVSATEISITNTGILSVGTTGSGISASTTSGAVTLANTGVTSAVAGTGIGVSAGTGAVTFSNTGVTSLAAGTYLSVNASTGAVTVSTNATSVNTASTIVARDSNGDFSAGTITANLADGTRALGQFYATRSLTYTAPASPLTTIAGTNGIVVASSNPGSGNGYSPQVRIVYASGDTTSGTNSAAVLQYSTSTGTTASPAAVATNQTMGTLNYDGYGTSGWAGIIASTGSGGGTTSIMPLQVQGYAVSAFTDSAGTVTNAPMGFRVRGFAASTNMSVTNRVNFIDHQAATATYKATTFNIQPPATATNMLSLGATTGVIQQNTLSLNNSAGTTTYAQFAAGGHTIGNVDAATTFVRARSVTASAGPVVILKNTTSATAAPVTGDGGTFRISTAGSNATVYQLAEIKATYSSTGDDAIDFAIANGDQTGATLTALSTINSKISGTTISAGTASATPGASTVSTVASFTAANTTIKSTALTLQTNAGVALVGSAISYNRVYGQWQYNTTVTPASANTAAVFPLGTADVNNIATVGSTSRLIPGASGAYNMQFSIQLNNSDNGSDHVAYIWLRKNGSDVAGSMGRVTATKGNATIAGWNYVISSANTTDYFELAYAVDSTQLTFPFYASTAFGPSTAALITTLTPVGA